MTRAESGTPEERQPEQGGPDIQAVDGIDGCMDCPAAVTATVARSAVTGARVLVATILHSPTCPWIAAIAPNGSYAHALSADRVVIHIRVER